MANIAAALKAEIARIARKELRAETDGVKKTVSRQRAEIAALKRRVQALDKELSRAGRTRAKPANDDGEAENDAVKFRFSAKGLAANRQRLQLSAAEYGLLVGATGQSIYNWETGKSKPRPGNMAGLAALRTMGKREVAARLEELKAAA